MNERRLRLTAVIADWVNSTVAWLLFNVVRYLLVASGFTSLGDFLLTPVVLASQILFPPVMLGVYWLSGYYNDMVRRSRLHDALSTMGSALIITMLALVGALLNDMTPDRARDYLLLGCLWGLLTLCVGVPRMVMATRLARGLRSGRLRQRAVIVGDSAQLAAGSFDHALDGASPERGLHPVGRALTDRHLPGTLSLDEALDMGLRGDADCYVIASPADNGMVLRLIYKLLPAGRPIYIERRPQGHAGMVTADTPSSPAATAKRARALDDDMLVDLTRTRPGRSTVNIKRLSDIVLSALALTVLSPLIGVLAMIVKLGSPGPAFYRQERVGYRGRNFDIIKLRTMHTDAEASGTPRLTSPGDGRVTRAGLIMRKYRLDELPQFWNVLRGDMSLVGPRPERRYFIDRIMESEPAYALVHLMRPGVTSWGMVKYGYASTTAQMIERLRYDLLYIDNAGFGVDMKILFYTLDTVISGKGL